MIQKDIIKKIVKILDVKLAEDIQVIGIRDLTIIADYFIIANGNSNTHTRAIAEEVEYQLSQEGIEPIRRESDSGNTWIILDYADIIVHVFYKETRDFYRLERVWADGDMLDITEFLE